MVSEARVGNDRRRRKSQVEAQIQPAVVRVKELVAYFEIQVDYDRYPGLPRHDRLVVTVPFPEPVDLGGAMAGLRKRVVSSLRLHGVQVNGEEVEDTSPYVDSPSALLPNYFEGGTAGHPLVPRPRIDCPHGQEDEPTLPGIGEGVPDTGAGGGSKR